MIAPFIEISLPEICNKITRQASVKWRTATAVQRVILSLTGDIREASLPITLICPVPMAMGDRMTVASLDALPMLTSCKDKIIQASVKHQELR